MAFVIFLAFIWTWWVRLRLRIPLPQAPGARMAVVFTNSFKQVWPSYSFTCGLNITSHVDTFFYSFCPKNNLASCKLIDASQDNLTCDDMYIYIRNLFKIYLIVNEIKNLNCLYRFLHLIIRKPQKIKKN